MINLKYILFFTLYTISACNSNDTKEETSSKEKLIYEQNQKIKELENRLDKIQENAPIVTPISEPSSAPIPLKTFFYIGDTENDVIEIQGTPTSIQDFGKRKVYFFGLSYVKFENGRVSSYDNYGKNLKLKVSTENSNTQNSDSQNKELTKFVFFTAFGGKKYYSKVFTLKNYTEDKMNSLKNCIIENIQSEAGRDQKIYCTEHLFETYTQASKSWQDESGTKMFFDSMCDVMLFNSN